MRDQVGPADVEYIECVITAPSVGNSMSARTTLRQCTVTGDVSARGRDSVVSGTQIGGVLGLGVGGIVEDSSCATLRASESSTVTNCTVTNYAIVSRHCTVDGSTAAFWRCVNTEEEPPEIAFRNMPPGQILVVDSGSTHAMWRKLAADAGMVLMDTDRASRIFGARLSDDPASATQPLRDLLSRPKDGSAGAWVDPLNDEAIDMLCDLAMLRDDGVEEYSLALVLALHPNPSSAV